LDLQYHVEVNEECQKLMRDNYKGRKAFHEDCKMRPSWI